MLLFVIVAVLSLLPLGAAQAQETKPGGDPAAARAGGNITAENLIGKYSGTYVFDSAKHFARPLSVEIVHAKGDEIQGTFTVYRKDCGGPAPMKGKLVDGTIEMTVQPVDMAGCTATAPKSIRLSVLENGNKLDGPMVGASGLTSKIRLSK